jgi:transposase
VKEFIAKKGILSLEWPGNSPDLNPIENLWAIMGSKINDKKPSSKRELHSSLENVWYNEISDDYLKNLIESMPRRIKAVLKNKGGPTKY